MTEELAGHGYRLNPGTLYPILHRLERTGLLRSHKRVESGKVQSVYRATRAGGKTLRIAKEKVRKLFGELVSPGGAYGVGDVELGKKYRFVQEGKYRPEVGVFPLVELPIGNCRLGLGNRQVWARLPLWVQKSYGKWTTYGGAGYQINHALGMKDSFFAGWLV